MSTLKHLVNTHCLMLVYYAFFQSIIEYGCEIFGHRYKTNSKMIEAMQVKAMKVIFGANCDVKKVMKNRGILSFRSLVNYKTYQFMYKAKQNVLPPNLLSLLLCPKIAVRFHVLFRNKDIC